MHSAAFNVTNEGRFVEQNWVWTFDVKLHVQKKVTEGKVSPSSREGRVKGEWVTDMECAGLFGIVTTYE